MNIKEKIKNLPTKPGCYLYYNSKHQVIYVGKAKNIKNRVKSYFTGAHTGKTQRLVNEIVDLEFIVTNTENESLLLEYNLIKKYYPKYNILLKDDKSYPYVVITNEKYPRVKVTRDSKIKQGKLYGPFTNVTAAKQMVEYINKSYNVVKCKKFPSEPCIYYHLNQCDAPCVYQIDDELYNSYIQEIKKILNGDVKKLVKKLKFQMVKQSELLNFESALEYKNMIESINELVEKQVVSKSSELNIDVIGYFKDNNNICVQVLHVRSGQIIERTGEIFEYVDDETSVISQFCMNMYYEKTIPDEVIIRNSEVEILSDILGVKFVNYQKGHKHKLLNMAEENARIILERYNASYSNKFSRKKKIKEEFENIIGKDIYRIECFDISHYSGVHTVGAMVVAKNYELVNKFYRKYKLKHEQNNDYASMKEVIYRRYYKALLDNDELPDLICVDGGKIQVSAALEVLSDLNLDISVVGLVKNKYHKTESILYDGNLISLKKSSELFKFLTSLQDEVHRFAINYHNSLRAKTVSASVLDNISGVGGKRKLELIKYYKNIDNIKLATLEELEKIVPKNVAKAVYDYFNCN